MRKLQRENTLPPKKSIGLSDDINWSNKDNIVFYETITSTGMAKFAKSAGLMNECDLNILLPYIKNAETVLEVGAGYGRVINFLLKNKISKKITAVERSTVLFNDLNKKYKKKINLLNVDILKYKKCIKKFDVILMLWSGIADFSETEQYEIIKRLSTFLKPNGKIILDTMPVNVVPVGFYKKQKQNYLLTTNNVTIHTRSPSTKEIDTYAKLAGLKKIIHLFYYTSTKRPRILHIMS